MTAPQAAGFMKDKGVLIHAFGKSQIRLVTHLGVSPEDVEKALEAFRKVFR
jgi:threonine aldolase